jgi:hypothetical protein
MMPSPVSTSIRTSGVLCIGPAAVSTGRSSPMFTGRTRTRPIVNSGAGSGPGELRIVLMA